MSNKQYKYFYKHTYKFSYTKGSKYQLFEEYNCIKF